MNMQMRDRKDARVSRNGRNEKNIVYRYTAGEKTWNKSLVSMCPFRGIKFGRGES